MTGKVVPLEFVTVRWLNCGASPSFYSHRTFLKDKGTKQVVSID